MRLTAASLYLPTNNLQTMLLMFIAVINTRRATIARSSNEMVSTLNASYTATLSKDSKHTKKKSKHP
jgi:hypothetical protein